MKQTSRPLTLDRQHLVQLLGDPEFFTACPAFLWLQDTALLQAAAYRRSGETSCCGGNWKLMAPIAEAFFQNLKQLHALGPQHVECVREYLGKKKCYRPQPVVLFYRPSDNARPHRFSF